MKRFLIAASLAAASLSLASCGGGSVQSAGQVAAKSETGLNDLYTAASRAGEKLIGIAWTKEQFKAADAKAYDVTIKAGKGLATATEFADALAALQNGVSK